MANIPWIDLFITIFIGMGPVKVLLVYVAVTKDVSRGLQNMVARKAVVTATVVALLLLVAGAFFMQILHFSTTALTIAGGLILLILALNIVLSPAEKKDQGAVPSEEALLSMAIYPMGIPLLLNPVGIVSLTVFSAEVQSAAGIAVIVAMVFVVALIDLGIFRIAHLLDKHLTYERILVLEKLLGILLAALAVQMIINGLAELGIVTPTGGH